MPFWLTYQYGEVLNSCEDVDEKHFFSPLTKAKCLDGGWFWGWAWQLGLPTAEAQRQAEWRAEATRALAEQEAISKDTPPISYTTRPSKHSVIGPRLPPRWVFWQYPFTIFFSKYCPYPICSHLLSAFCREARVLDMTIHIMILLTNRG